MDDFDRLVTVIYSFAKPNKYSARLRINHDHGPNLAFLFPIIILVDTDSIYPKQTRNTSMSKPTQSCIQILGDG
jgi:hypothetical protein